MKCMDTQTLIEASRRAKAAGLDRPASDGLAAKLDPRGVHVVQNHVALDDGRYVRCVVIFKLSGEDAGRAAQVDLLAADFNALPHAETVMAHLRGAEADDGTPA